MLLQHQPVVSPSCPCNLCFPQFQRCCPDAPSVWNSLASGIYTCSSSRTFCHLLKIHCFDQDFKSSSGSRKCLRFGLWPTLWTLKDFIYLPTCLHTYLIVITRMMDKKWRSSGVRVGTEWGILLDYRNYVFRFDCVLNQSVGDFCQFGLCIGESAELHAVKDHWLFAGVTLNNASDLRAISDL